MVIVGEEGCGGVGRNVGSVVYMYISRRNRVPVCFPSGLFVQARWKLVATLYALLLVLQILSAHHGISRFSSPGRAPD
jgi:hypothetical protein